MIDPGFRRDLARAVGPGGFLSEPSDLLTYESDALAHLRAVPGAVVLPASAAEVQAVVRLCHTAGVPFVEAASRLATATPRSPHRMARHVTDDGIVVVDDVITTGATAEACARSDAAIVWNLLSLTLTYRRRSNGQAAELR